VPAPSAVVQDRLAVLAALWQNGGSSLPTDPTALSTALSAQGVPTTTGIVFSDGSTGSAQVPASGSLSVSVGLPQAASGISGVQWTVTAETGIAGTVPYGGDTNAVPLVLSSASGSSTAVTMPAAPGAYRLYAYVLGPGGATVATATAPLNVV
jgi:hypothetical protein